MGSRGYVFGSAVNRLPNVKAGVLACRGGRFGKASGFFRPKPIVMPSVLHKANAERTAPGTRIPRAIVGLYSP